MATKKIKSDISIEQGLSFPNKTASRALKIDSSGNAVESTVTETELEYLSGTTSAVQTQLNAKADLVGGKIPSSQIPAVAITDVFSVADITARDALTIGTGDGEVQEGDVAVVTDASADAAIVSGSASYIYSGASWILLKSGDDVLSVAGKTGAVTLVAADITDFDTEVSNNTDVAANTAARHAAMTLNAGAATQESASLTGQELTLNQATTTTDGVMSSEDKSKLDGIEALADVTDATNVAAAGATMDADTSLVGNGYFLDEDDMSSNDATKVPSQQSVKAYVDNNSGNVSAGDIKEVQATLADNQVAAADVTDGVTPLAFANGTVRSFDVQISVTRGATFEVYKLLGVQKSASWDMVIESAGDDTGMTFSITAAGQIQYTSTSTGTAPVVAYRADTTSV